MKLILAASAVVLATIFIWLSSPGQVAKRAELRQAVERRQAARVEKQSSDRAAVIARHSWVAGMTSDELSRSLGKLRHTHASDGADGRFDVYEFGGYTFYFTNDQLVRWSTNTP